MHSGSAKFCAIIAAMSVIVLSGASAQNARLIQVKMGLESLSQPQLEQLWFWADAFAQAEILLSNCGINANIERRSLSAVQSCVDEASLRKVRQHFHARVEFHKEKPKLPCDKAEVKKLIRTYEDIITKQINEAARLCRACLVC